MSNPVREYRELTGYSIAKIAEHLGRSPSNINNIIKEYGTATASPEMLERLEKVLAFYNNSDFAGLQNYLKFESKKRSEARSMPRHYIWHKEELNMSQERFDIFGNRKDSEMRPCLCCEKEFLSDSIAHRRCYRCKKNAERIYVEDHSLSRSMPANVHVFIVSPVIDLEVTASLLEEMALI